MTAIQKEPNEQLTSLYQGIIPTTYIKSGIGEKVWARATSITSNAECARHYGISTQFNWLEGTVVDAENELIKSGTLREWYITYDYIIEEDGITKRVHLINRNVKYVPMLPPHPRPKY